MMIILFLVFIYLLYILSVYIFSNYINKKLLLNFPNQVGKKLLTGETRWNTTQKPLWGGITFYIIFLLSVIAMILYDKESLIMNTQFLGIFIAITLSFIGGLIDDYRGTKSYFKLLFQLAVGLIFVSTGTVIEITNNWIINDLITIFWTVLIITAIDISDNMDGVCATICLFIFITFLILLVKLYILSPFILLILAMCAALLSFYRFNFPPSKIFMGDAGSQLLGSIVVALSILFIWNHPRIHLDEYPYKPMLAALIAFALPLIDLAIVSSKRIFIEKKSPLIGGKDHTSHHLVYAGLSERKVNLVFVIISTLSTVLAVSIIEFIHNWNLFYSFMIVLYLFILFGILFYIGIKKNPTTK